MSACSHFLAPAPCPFQRYDISFKTLYQQPSSAYALDLFRQMLLLSAPRLVRFEDFKEGGQEREAQRTRERSKLVRC